MDVIEPCNLCSAKDNEMFHMTAHIGRLSQMMSDDHHIIMALRQEILTTRTLMTEEQLKELRELLMKAHRKQGDLK
jgi:hypothetical protein